MRAACTLEGEVDCKSSRISPGVSPSAIEKFLSCYRRGHVAVSSDVGGHCQRGRFIHYLYTYHVPGDGDLGNSTGIPASARGPPCTRVLIPSVRVFILRGCRVQSRLGFPEGFLECFFFHS